jgi:ADP-heptose:LPS heptosyltransferase
MTARKPEGAGRSEGADASRPARMTARKPEGADASRPARLLAVCTGGGVGDLLAATPAMSALARTFGSPVTVLASPYAAPLLRGHPAVAEVMSDDSSTPISETIEAVRARDFTHAVVFWSTPRVAAIVQRARIPIRAGQSRRLYSWRYTVRVPVRTESGDVTSRWSDVQMDYARALGAVAQASDFIINIPMDAADEREADAVLAAAGVTGRFVVFHTVRGMRLEGVQWPVESFAKIGDALGRAFDAPIVLTGTAAERTVIDDLASRIAAPHATIAGATSLRALAAVLKRSVLVVALDSGPMHIAAAVGAPTVGIFALKTDLPRRWQPLGPRVALVEPSYPCPGCRKETCRSFDCYAALSPDAVVSAARSLF